MFWNPHHLRPLHVSDDFLGHPNGAVPTPFLLPNFVSNHLAIGLLFDHVRGAIAFVSPVGLGVDERTLDCELLFVLLIRKLLPWLRTLVGLVAFLCGTLSKSRWTPSQASSPCLHGYLEKVGHCSLCSCPLI